MDQGQPDSKRPRLWSAGSHAGVAVSLLHPTPSPTSAQLPHHPAPPPGQYQPPSHPYSRPPEHHPLPLAHPPPPPPHIIPPPPPPHQGPNHIDDRRHHEPDRYPPMQEHRQPPPSPAHPPYPGYSSRDPMNVKADPGEDVLPQLRRPHSTGTAPEALPGTPHPPLPPHQPPLDDHRRHMSFDGGPGPQLYRQPSYPPPPPTPISHGQPYDYSHSYAHHAEMQYPIPIMATGRRKAQRASQACDSCRQLKAKCDELKPCKSCKEKKLECKYRDPAPKAQDKVSADILDAIQHLAKRFDRRMSKFERALFKSGVHVEPSVEHMMDDDDDDDRRPTSAASTAHGADDSTSYSPENAMNSAEMVDAEGHEGRAEVGSEAEAQIAASYQARTTLRELAKDEEMEDHPPGPPVAPGQPAIPLNHTTLASMLLKWRPIKLLVQTHLDREGIKYEDEFPIRQEERRGLLRLFGRGEGRDSGLGDRETNTDQGVLLEGYDDRSDTGAPSPAEYWGTIGGSSPPNTSESKGGHRYGMELKEEKIWEYVRSYQENIQNMHPLIIPRELDAMVRLFIENVQPSKAKSSKGATTSAAVAKWTNPSVFADTGVKRKRSPTTEGSDTTPSTSTTSDRPVFQRSIQNALVLLVLALGKICLERGKIAEVVAVGEPNLGSPQARNGVPQSPLQGSPPSSAFNPHSSRVASPRDNTTASRRASFQGGWVPFKPVPRNMDVIPGLDYFAVATDILGGQLGGATLRHVYAYILAGLYHGQLGRVMESYAYIKQAGYSLQIKMRPSLDRLSKLQKHQPFNPTAIQSLRDNQLIFAFWTCLQLESDIVAELPLPQSNILAYEEIMPYPNVDLARAHGFDQRVLASYTAQLYLRKSLNQIHQMLYDPSKSPQGPLSQTVRLDGGFNIYEFLQEALDMRFVPQEFKFEQDDPPATDILSARLRAKYWGAQNITLRPFIKRIFDFNQRHTALNSPVPISGDFRSEMSVPFIGPEATTEEEIDPRIIEYARRAIRALIQSTKSFHGLGDQRFIITNVFGTAHAQWGNLLVLSAVYRDPILSRYIDEATLRDLFAKTIAFFKIIAHATSALSIDMRILQGLERDLFHPRSVDMTGPNSSFSSTTSVGPQLAPMMTSPNAAAGLHLAGGILPPPPIGLPP